MTPAISDYDKAVAALKASNGNRKARRDFTKATTGHGNFWMRTLAKHDMVWVEDGAS